MDQNMDQQENILIQTKDYTLLDNNTPIARFIAASTSLLPR